MFNFRKISNYKNIFLYYNLYDIYLNNIFYLDIILPISKHFISLISLITTGQYFEPFQSITAQKNIYIL